MRLALLLTTALLMALLAPLPGQGTDAATPSSPTLTGSPRIFRIGYLRRESTGLPTKAQLEVLRGWLEQHPQVGPALRAARYDRVGLYATDGAGDMIRRLSAREFDLAFVPATIHARQQGDYAVILKTRKAGDFSSPTGTVLRRGVVIASPRSSLFTGELSSARLREALETERLAVVSTQSIAGFHAPLLELRERHGATLEGGYLWFESSEEVVKAVVSGLAHIGACEEAAVGQALESAGSEGQRGQLLRVVHTANPTPTDPVVVRHSLAPSRSELGRLLGSALAEFAFDGGFGEVQLVTGRDGDYERTRQLLAEFDRVIGEVDE